MIRTYELSFASVFRVSDLSTPMIIAVLSALHTFLKYDALEDRHHQYSRHFANLQVDLETLLAKSPITRGDPITVVERYKTKYTVLINNAHDLPE